MRSRNKEQARLLESTSSQHHSFLAEESQMELEVLPPEDCPRPDPLSLADAARKRKRPNDDRENEPFVDDDYDWSAFMSSPRQPTPSPPRRTVPRRPPAVTRAPTFDSGWHLPMQQVKPRTSNTRTAPVNNPFGLKLDAKGRPLAPVQTGSRRRERF